MRFQGSTQEVTFHTKQYVWKNAYYFYILKSMHHDSTTIEYVVCDFGRNPWVVSENPASLFLYCLTDCQLPPTDIHQSLVSRGHSINQPSSRRYSQASPVSSAPFLQSDKREAWCWSIGRALLTLHNTVRHSAPLLARHAKRRRWPYIWLRDRQRIDGVVFVCVCDVARG